MVVESPTKIRTLKKFLGSDFDVAATVGHIKDLPAKELGVSIEEGFRPTYTTIQGKEKVVRALKKAAASAEDIYLAPDPDREGEAIAYHAVEILKKKGRQPLLAALDIYRPAAAEQLEILGRQVDIPVFRKDAKKVGDIIQTQSQSHVQS